MYRNPVLQQDPVQTIMKILGKEGKPIGIGGGTCAAFFRRKGINAVVWGISAPESYHKPEDGDIDFIGISLRSILITNSVSSFSTATAIRVQYTRI